MRNLRFLLSPILKNVIFVEILYCIKHKKLLIKVTSQYTSNYALYTSYDAGFGFTMVI